MQIISPANETVLSLLKRFSKTAADSRLLHYCAHAAVDEGVLLMNLLTRELVLLTAAEFERATELEYLKDRWFVVPQDTNEQELAAFVRWFLKNRRKKDDAITGYTIFPTTDCNARCFYCFELGRSRMPMSQEIARKTVQYIKDHCGGKRVKLSWFGGEPLLNPQAIDTICQGLRQENIAFYSYVVTNGYLFDDTMIRKAVENWNVRNVQITLDGTEAVYNKTKAYVCREGNPYQIVLGNMARLLDAGISVVVRMNMDLYNAEDLLRLAEELGRRFGGLPNLRAYVRHIFSNDQPIAQRHDPEGWQLREAAIRRIEEQLAACSLASRRGISREIRLSYCKADCGSAVTILPDGHIGLCEHFSESEFAGHLDREDLDRDMVASWQETMPEIPECATCFAYPECIKLKKCANASVCYLQHRQWYLRQIRQQMVNEYRRWQAKGPTETDETDNENC